MSLTNIERADPAPPAQARARLLPSWPVVMLMACACLYASPYHASNMDIIPDSIEYAVGAQRFATLGHFNIAINGTAYPSRYPAWFPVLILSPLYRLFPTHMGIGILAIFAFSLLAVAAAYAIGFRLAGEWGGVAAAFLLIQIPDFVVMAHMIMSDVPFFALGMLGAWLFLKMSPGATRWQWVAAALISALACAVRPVGAAVLLPFLALALRRRPQRAGLTLAAYLCLPLALLALASCAYNQIEFGHWSRTGYHYWDPQDYEFSGVTFSTSYVHPNLNCLLGRRSDAVWLIALIGGVALWRRRAPALRPFLAFLALAAVPITLFHLFYKFTDVRFHMLLFGLAACLGGAGLASLLPAVWHRQRWAPALAALAGLALVWHPHPIAPPQRRLLADAIAASTPPNAVVVTSLEPVYLEPMVQRGTARVIIPVDPSVQYGRQIIAPRPMPVHLRQHPIDWSTREANYERLWGWHRIIPWTAQERPDLVAGLVRGPNPVYLCLAPNDPRWAEWEKLFHLVPVNTRVSRILLPAGHTL